jgi:1-acyl-sn-glycerol-3-phosphate acyltransferase
MIRRSVRARFRAVHWVPPDLPAGPVIFACNHHGWHDGYIMFHVVTATQKRALDWITEYAAFPLFGKVGGLPFPAEDAAIRAQTIRRTVRLMRSEGRSLILFCESHLHRPPELLPFGRALELIAAQVPGASVIPTAIRYELSLHERPEAFVDFGPPVDPGPELSARTRLAVQHALDGLAARIAHQPESFQLLARGTLDVNERLDLRRFRRPK